MSTTFTDPTGPLVTEAQPDPREALSERLIEAMVATLETKSIFLGVELGLYRALRDGGPCAADELAHRAGIHPRYAREWLEQQVTAGIVVATDAGWPTDDGAGPLHGGSAVFSLPDPHADVLVDEDSPFNVSGGTRMIAGIARVLERLPEAYRSGAGIPYADFGPQIRVGIAAFNRPMFRHELGSTWLPAVAEIHDRLIAPKSARVLDLGCGEGASSIAIAEAYPNAHIVGVDLDEASIIEATDVANQTPLADRVRFVSGDAAQLVGTVGTFDVVTIFEALHDMGDPVGALRTARALLAPGGNVLVADEKVAEAFRGPGDLVERFNYGWSVLHCLPATLAERPVEANGTVLRTRTVQRWAAEAGYGRCVVVDLDHPLWRFYHLSH